MESKYIEETYQLLIELIQNKCVNPPGDEMRSIKTIEKFLKNKGVSCKVFESKKNRGNLVAVIPGTDKEAPGLIFGPSHVDVVPVTKPNDWKEDPFGSVRKDGFFGVEAHWICYLLLLHKFMLLFYSHKKNSIQKEIWSCLLSQMRKQGGCGELIG